MNWMEKFPEVLVEVFKIKKKTTFKCLFLKYYNIFKNGVVMGISYAHADFYESRKVPDNTHQCFKY